MIASCWDWPSLKYAYFIIEDNPLDAGGWSHTRGIVSKEKNADPKGSIAFDDCLPALPEQCYYAGAGDFCVGELFVKRDGKPRPEVDLAAMKAQGTPALKKVVELLEGSSVSVIGNSRGELSESRSNPRTSTSDAGRKSLWALLVPSFAAIGTGFAMYQLFSSENRTDVNVQTLLFAWAAGVAVGLTVGQEYAEQPLNQDEVN